MYASVREPGSHFYFIYSSANEIGLAREGPFQIQIQW